MLAGRERKEVEIVREFLEKRASVETSDTPARKVQKQFEAELSILPPENQKGVQAILALIPEIVENWDKKWTPQDLVATLPTIRQTAQNFLDVLRPSKEKLGYSWGKTKSTVLEDAEEESWRTLGPGYIGRRAIHTKAWFTTWDAWFDWRKREKMALPLPLLYVHPSLRKFNKWCEAGSHAFREVAEAIAAAAIWESAKGEPGFGEKNPFLPLLDLYRQGAFSVEFWQVGESPESLEERLVVHFPLKRKGLGCLTFPDGQSGDNRVLFFHGRERSCWAIQPLTSLAPPRIMAEVLT